MIDDFQASHSKVVSTETEKEEHLNSAICLSTFARIGTDKCRFSQSINHFLNRLQHVSLDTLYAWAASALTCNDTESLLLLLDQPNVESIMHRRHDGSKTRSFLESAVMTDRKDAFDILISHGSPVEQKPMEDYVATLFHTVAQYELIYYQHFFQVIYDHGEDVNNQPGAEHNYCSAMMIAVQAGNLPVLDFLLHHGADMNGEDEWVLSELIAKRSAAVIPVLDFVFDHPRGPPHFTTESITRTNALHLSAGPRFAEKDTWQNHENLISGSTAVLDYLLHRFPGPNQHVNAKDVEGNTALHVAAYHGCDWAVKLLLGAGADPYVQNNQGLNPYHCTLSERKFHRLTVAVSFEDFDPDVTGYALASVEGPRACRVLLCDENGKPRTTKLRFRQRIDTFLRLKK